jgi:hypothetical protein
MSDNFYTKWSNTDPKTNFTVASMDTVPAALDLAITYLKNVIVTCAGDITYNKSNGQLAWSAALHIYFNDSNGYAKHNTVATGNITLSDNQFAYVTLSETDDATLTVSAASITTGSSSNYIAYNSLVLAYRDTTSDNIYPVYLHGTLNQTGISSIGSFASPITSSGTYTLVADNCYNKILFYDDTDIIALPAAMAGMNIIIYNAGSNTITIDPNGSDVIVRDGTAQTGGVQITLSAGVGNYVTLLADAANHWVTLNYKGTLAEGS